MSQAPPPPQPRMPASPPGPSLVSCFSVPMRTGTRQLRERGWHVRALIQIPFRRLGRAPARTRTHARAHTCTRAHAHTPVLRRHLGTHAVARRRQWPPSKGPQATPIGQLVPSLGPNLDLRSVIFLFRAHPRTFRQTTQFGEEIHCPPCVRPKFPRVHCCQRFRALGLLCPKYTVKVQISAPVRQHPEALLPSAGRF